MKRFAKTEFFHLIKANNNNPSLLEDEYEKFACYLFTESSVCTTKEVYYYALVYTRVEPSSLTEVSKKKNTVTYLHKTIELIDIQIERE